MKSTTLNIARSQQGTSKALPEKVGKHVKRVDAALPGKHTRQLYNQLSGKEASALAQLRTGMARLNRYLYRINIAQRDQCEYGQARETIEHFLFRCWEMDDISDRNAAMHQHPPRQHILLPGREIALR
jgi:hypothetical protein